MAINYIIERYKSGELTIDEANAELKAAGANIYLKPLTDEERATKAAVECEEGACDIGREPLHLPDRPDMSRRTDLAGLTVVQQTRGGQYEVHYNEAGYARSAVLL